MGNDDATNLRKLADDVRKLLDDPIGIAADKHAKADERWEGPTATRIRGELGTRKGKLETMATNIETEAGSAAKRTSSGNGDMWCRPGTRSERPWPDRQLEGGLSPSSPGCAGSP